MTDTIKIGLTTILIILSAPLWIPIWIFGKAVEGVIGVWYYLYD